MSPAVDYAQCQSWLREHRDDIQWDLNESMAAILEDLTAEFDETKPLAGRR